MRRIVKDYDNLPEEIVMAVKQKYPTGYESHLISYTDKDGKAVSALPFQAADIHYLIRMTVAEARQIVSDDADFDDEGTLRQAPVEDDIDLDNEYGGSDEDVEDLADTSSDEDDEDHIIPTRRRSKDDDDGYDDDY